MRATHRLNPFDRSRRVSRLLPWLAAASLALVAPGVARAQTTVTWNGATDTTWTQPDSTSWSGATYSSGNTALFNGSGVGTVTISGTVTPGQINVTSGSYTFAGGAIGGSGGISKSGTSTLTLTGSNLYSGTTSITAGVLNIQNANALGSTAAGTVVSNSAALQIQGGITVSGESLTLAGQGFGGADGALRNISGANTWTGNIAINDLNSRAANNIDNTNPVRIASDAGNLLISGNITLAAGVGSTIASFGNQGNGTIEISGNISGGSAGVNTFFRSSAGSGTTTFSGTNTYLGYTTLNNNGTLVVRGGSAIPDTSLMIFNGSSGLVLQSSETIGSLISAFAATGTVSLGSNTLTINADPAAPADPYSNGAAGAFWTVISGSGGIVKTGGGTLILRSGSNSYTGGTTLNAGRLVFRSGGLGPSGAITLAGGTLQWLGNTQDISSRLTLVSGSTATLDTNGYDVTFATGFGGSTSGALVKTGGGTLTLSGSNSYTGGTTLNSGVIQATAANALGSSGGVTLNAGRLTFVSGGLGSSGTVALNGGTLQWASGNTQDISGRIALASGSTATLDTNGNNVTLATGFGGSTTAALVKIGSGTLTLSGSNSYSGGTTLNAGAIRLNNANALGGGAVNVNGSGTLDLGGLSASVGALSGQPGAVITTNNAAGTATLTTAINSGTSIFSGAIQDNGSGVVALTKSGAGVLTLSGSSSFSGGTTITGGRVFATSDSSLGSGLVRLQGGDVRLNPGVTLTAPIELTTADTVFDLPTDFYVEYLVVGGGGGGAAGGGGGGGAGGVVLGSTTLGNGSYNVTVGAAGSGGTAGDSSAQRGTAGSASSFNGLTGGGGGTAGSQDATAGSGQGGSGGGGGGGTNGPANQTAGSAGNQGLANAGAAGVQSMTELNYGGVGGGGGGAMAAGLGKNGGIGLVSSFSGLSVTYASGGGGGAQSGNTGGVGGTGAGNGGTVGSGSAGTSATTYGSGGGGGATTGAPSFTLSPGGNGMQGVVIVRYSGAPVATGGSITTGSGAAAGYTLHTFTTTTGTASFALTVPDAATIGGNLAGAGGILKTGATTLVLSGSNSFTGNTTVSAGSLRLGNANALGRSTFTGGAGSLSFGSLTAATFGGLSGSSNLVLSNSSAAAVALSLGANDQSTTYSGGLSGPGSLAKIGSGALTLSGSSNFAGSTAIDVGQLTVNGVLGTSGVTVASGAILGGSGVINAPVTVLSGGIVAPGNSPGTLTVNDAYSLADGSILNFELNPANTAVGGGINDLITGVTNLTLDGILNISGAGDWTAAANNSSWRLFNYSGTLTNNVLSLGTTPTLASGQSFQIDTSTTGQVNLVIVPEPGALALAGIGIALAARALRRRA